jgi:hypothetical protein
MQQSTTMQSMVPTTDTTTSVAMAASRLPSLTPVTLGVVVRPAATHQQEEQPEDAVRLAGLARIEHVEVRSAAGNAYEVCVFHHARVSRIPVPVTAIAAPQLVKPSPDGARSSRSPDATVTRSFAAFRQLRDAVYYAAMDGHSTLRSCGFCASVVDAVLLDQAQPHAYQAWLYDSATVCGLLSAFLNELVTKAVGATVLDPRFRGGRRAGGQTLTPAVCPVQSAVRSLVVAFLTDAVGTADL